MAVKGAHFEEYIGRFPKEFQSELKAKLDCKKALEADQRLKIPLRTWLAFLTPPKESARAFIPPNYKSVWKLKEAMLKSFEHPKQFLDMRDPLHRSSDCVTLAMLENIFDLNGKKILMSKGRYEEWLDVAEQFGLWKLRYALEDMIFKTFDPENFSLFESVVEKQMFIDTHLVRAIRAILEEALKHAGLKEFSIQNRRKNIYGVYKKVALKQKSINDIYDIHGFRILTSSEADCRKAVEVLHRLWRHFPERYKDYIAEPKENGYQSLHTVLRCLEGKLIEFQVRTKDMDMVAASGPANHSNYKKNSRNLTLNGLS